MTVDVSILGQNFLNPPILFFFLGVLAVWVRSDLEIPQPLPRLFSLYLLLSIGFHGGEKLRASGFTPDVAWTIVAAMGMAILVPVYSYVILRRKLDVYNAAATAATYGSVSAVTFLAGAAFLTKMEIPYGGHMVAAMALMESPAIVIGVFFARTFGKASGDKSSHGWGNLLRDAITNASVFLLLGSMVIGFATGKAGAAAMEPFIGDIFKGMLAFFLLDIGIVAARRLRDLRQSGPFLILFAIFIPLFNGLLGVGIAHVTGMSAGDAILFALLCGSASYIAVPAAMRMAVPEANPSLFVAMALGITFPFNLAIGIPLYTALVRNFWGA